MEKQSHLSEDFVETQANLPPLGTAPLGLSIYKISES